MPAPSLLDVKAYLGDQSSWTDAQVSSAYKAEKAAQAARCRVPEDSAEWPEDLAEALKRRVARNLYMRGNPSGFESSLSEFGAQSQRIGADSELRRLEGPWRKLVVG